MDVFEAVADPVRRRIVTLLAEAPLPAGQVAGAFDISRPAVSRHLRVLRDSGIVEVEAVGRARVYRLQIDRLAVLDRWVAGLRSPLTRHLDALDTEVHRTRRERERGAAPRSDRRSHAEEQTA